MSAQPDDALAPLDVARIRADFPLLSREVNGINPGSGRVRMALVAPLAECIEAAQRIRRFIEGRTA